MANSVKDELADQPIAEISEVHKGCVFLPLDFLSALFNFVASIEDHLPEALEGHPAALLRELSAGMSRLGDLYTGLYPDALADELNEMADQLDDRDLLWSAEVDLINEDAPELGYDVTLYGTKKSN